jgi:hypothetical protein
MVSEKRLMPRIYMPAIAPADIEKFKTDKPFLLRADLPIGAAFVSVCSVPSIIDLLGMSGGGGPPAFAYLVDPDEPRSNRVLLTTHVPEEPFPQPPGQLRVVRAVRGVVQVMGMLLVCFEWFGEDVWMLEELFEAAGCLIVDTQPYVIPPMLMQMALAKSAQAQKTHEQAQKKSAG